MTAAPASTPRLSGLTDPATDTGTDAVLTSDEARQRRLAHEARVDEWIVPHLERRSRGEAHPVHDFLFTYYRLSPAALRRWHPGIGVAVSGAETARCAESTGHRMLGDRAVVDVDWIRRHRDRIEWIERLLRSTAARRPLLSCFGLHEWAMVYRSADRRHEQYPLRLGAAGTDSVVESSSLTCTHYDAVRFFTPAARPLNAVDPSRERQHLLDQPGCLHVGMDLYKWAFHLGPLVASELVADCLQLARDIRELDMRASPYDLSSLGYSALRVETAAGRAAYAAAQRDFADQAQPLRQDLLTAGRAGLRVVSRSD